MIRLTPIVILLGLAACTQSATPTSGVDVASERMAILATDGAFSDRSAEVGVAQAFSEYLTEDALMLPAGSSPVTGSQAIHELMSSGGEYSLTWEPRDAQVAQSGELGWSWGEYTASSVADDGSANLSYGKYVSIWRKQEDGSWKAIVDIGNQSPGPGPLQP